MKNYQVYVDVTFSGTIEVKANSKKEAKEIIKSRYFAPSDIRTFSHIKTSVVEVNEQKGGNDEFYK